MSGYHQGVQQSVVSLGHARPPWYATYKARFHAQTRPHWGFSFGHSRHPSFTSSSEVERPGNGVPPTGVPPLGRLVSL